MTDTEAMKFAKQIAFDACKRLGVDRIEIDANFRYHDYKMEIRPVIDRLAYVLYFPELTKPVYREIKVLDDVLAIEPAKEKNENQNTNRISLLTTGHAS